MEIENAWKSAPVVIGYEVTLEGLFHIVKNDKEPDAEPKRDQITKAPFWYHACYVDLGTSESMIEIRYQVDDLIQKFLISRSAFYAQGWVSKIAGKYKLPIPPSTKTHSCIADYLYKADLACQKVGYTSTHAGWHTLPNGTNEYVPFGSIKPSPKSAGIKKRFSYISAKGDENLWYEKLFEVLKINPLAIVPFAGSLAAPLLSLLDTQSVVIDIHNTSSSGKTIAGLMAMSIWGKPDKLKINWDSTQVALEQNATAFSDLPLFFDESQLNTYPKGIGVSIYNIANGMGRERGAAGGGTQLTGTWSTVLISTGEASLLSIIPQNFSGLDARIIPVEGKTLGSLDASGAQAITMFVKNNYGFLAPKYIEHLKNVNLENLQDTYIGYVEKLRKSVIQGDTIQMRKAETYATLLVAIDELAKVLPTYEKECWLLFHSLMEYWKTICIMHQNKQMAQKALRILYDYSISNGDKFISTTKGSKNRVGAMHKHGVGFLVTPFEKILQKNGLSHENVLREFKERKWLLLNKKGSLKIRTTLDGGNCYLYVLSQEANKAYEADHLTESSKDYDDIASEKIDSAKEMHLMNSLH